jgi:hypothetical protein
MTELVKAFQQNGWIIIRDFFTLDEARRIKEGTERSIKEKLQLDLLCNPYLSDLTVLNPKIVEVVKQLLEGNPIYIGDSNISHNDWAVSLHKDNPDRFDANAPDWQSDYSILRMGIYLQDYTRTSGGLIVRDGSHKFPTRWKGKIINVQSRPTDLVLWNLRTTHSGSARRLKLFPALDLNPYVCKLFPAFLFIPAPETRMALFLSYGKESHHMDRYIKYLKSRSYAVNRWRNMNITDDLIVKGEKIGLKVLNLTLEAKQIENTTLHEKHVELGY